MARIIVLISCLIIFAILLPLQASDVDRLTEQLLSSPVTGKPAASLVVNKGFAGSNTETLKKLAQAVGFVDENGAMVETVLTTSSKTILEFKTELNGWQAQDRLKQARVIEEADAVSLLEKLIAEAHQSNQNNHAGFVAFLKSVNAQAKAAKLTSLDDAKLPSGDEKGPLYYFAQRFYLEKAIEALKERAAEVEKRNGKLLYSGPYLGSIGRNRNWDAIMLHAWRAKAFTAPWVADLSWQNGEFSPQVTGYYLALARAARTSAPIFCDLHVGELRASRNKSDARDVPGNNPAAIRRSFYQALANGSRAIRFVGANPTPPAEGAKGDEAKDEWLPAARIESWKTIRELSHEAGQNESFFLDAKPRASELAVVVSLTGELWDGSLWVHEERKALYHAARLGGHNLRIITEEDVQQGLPLNLATVYLLGTHIQKRTAEALAEWVKANKSLGLVGGPLRDEYDQPLTELHELMGITQATWENKQEAGPAKIALAQLKPFDNIAWNYAGLKRTIPVVYGKLSMTIDKKQAADVDVFGQFPDKSPAIIRHVLPGTKVHVWTFGAPIGSGWLKTVLPPRDWVRGQSPNSYNHRLLIREADGDVGDIATSASGEARWDVITDRLEVESVLMESPRNAGMVCINWSERPQKVFLTAQFLPAKYLHATSMVQGELETKRAGSTLSFKTTVNITDVIKFEP
jgi:hypothetical protein